MTCRGEFAQAWMGQSIVPEQFNKAEAGELDQHATESIGSMINGPETCPNRSFSVLTLITKGA